jgi:hypothetical protein
VREAFAENFSRRNELGAACCAYYQERIAVNLWGGVRNAATGEPWEEDTMVLVYSATKGLAAMAMAIAHSRGWLDYEERVCTYWPEFAQQGKEKITVRQLLAHQAGLFALPEAADRNLIADLDRLAIVLARQKPAWQPAERQAYHAITLGYYQGELLRRIDPKRRSLGHSSKMKLRRRSGSMSISACRNQSPIPDWRRSNGQAAMLTKMPFPLALASLNLRSNLRGAMVGTGIALDSERIYVRELEVPSRGVWAPRAPLRRRRAFSQPEGASLGCEQRRWKHLRGTASTMNA